MLFEPVQYNETRDNAIFQLEIFTSRITKYNVPVFIAWNSEFVIVSQSKERGWDGTVTTGKRTNMGILSYF